MATNELNISGKAIAIKPETLNEGDRKRAEELAIILGGVFLWLMQGRLKFNPETQQWTLTSSSGVKQIITDQHIRAAQLKAQRTIANRLEKEARNARGGTIADWQKKTSKTIGAAYLLFGMLGLGAVDRMTEHWAKQIQKQIDFHKRFLNRFAKAIQKKKVITGRQLAVRARKYAAGLNAAAHRIKHMVMTMAGYTEAQRHRTIAESCPECIEYDHNHAGWMPIDAMPKIGTLLCKSYCRCYIEFR